MRRITTAMAVAAILVSSVAPTVAQPSATDSQYAAVAYPLTDTNGNNISDGLETMIKAARPTDQISVVVTFQNEALAGLSERLLPQQALSHRLSLISGFSASLTSAQITALSKHPGLIRVEENFTVSVTNASANSVYGTELARNDYGVDGTGVGICILDTGYDPNHEQLDDVGKLAGWFDAINGASAAYDDQGHGTHVAATAAGAGTGGTNAAKYRGVAPGTEIYAAKVLNSSGNSVADSVQQGIAWCVDQPGVDVISMSLSTTAGSDGLDSLSQTVNAAVDAGKIVVVAAGNSGDGPGTVGSPGAAEKAITVGAASRLNGIYLAPFSSRGPTLSPSLLTKPDITAPGISITSANAGSTSGYTAGSGTSMATPFTAGTIALMLDVNSGLTSTDVKSLIASTAQDRGSTGKDNHWGWGLLDGYALVSEADGISSYDTTVFPTSTVITGSVSAGSVWTHTFGVASEELDIPIAATVILDGAPVCTLGSGSFCFAWEWSPDLEARLIDPSGAQLMFSECPARGDCGSMGQQETLHAMPTTAGEYKIEVIPVSAGGSFTIDLSSGPDPNAADTSAPSVSVSSPANWSTINAPVSVTGSSSDNVGVTQVLLEIYDRDTGNWWNGTDWQTGRTTFDAALGAGSTSRTWSYDFAPPTPASQPYWVTIRSFDAAGNPSNYNYTNFTIS